MLEGEEPPADEALWRFSTAFYRLPGVARALIALQDRDSLDVNLMLFAIWLGISARGRVTSDTLAAAERATRTIRNEIVEPLRTIRRTLRHHPDEDVQRLRDGVKALELASEKLVQTRLARLAEPMGTDISMAARRADARANFALYLGSESTAGGEAAIIREALETLASGY
jgi:uncharacterized protein (TIGR02444 family)